VVEVEMGEEDVQLDRRIVEHRHTEGSHPGSGIEDEHMAAGQAHLDARRVSAVPDRVGSRSRD
jgi:hypothetical protein